jgi:MYXO-CTERM domain-containing protein
VPPVVAPSNEGSGATGDATDTKTTTAAKTGGGGCSVGSGNVSGGAVALLGLAAALALLGRRRHQN